MKKTANNFILHIYLFIITVLYQYHLILYRKEDVEEKTRIKCEHKQEKISG